LLAKTNLKESALGTVAVFVHDNLDFSSPMNVLMMLLSSVVFVGFVFRREQESVEAGLAWVAVLSGDALIF
jgi:hypothetical protein